MYPQKYFTLNFFINEIFSVEKFLNYNIQQTMYIFTNLVTDDLATLARGKYLRYTYV